MRKMMKEGDSTRYSPAPTLATLATCAMWLAYAALVQKRWDLVGINAVGILPFSAGYMCLFVYYRPTRGGRARLAGATAGILASVALLYYACFGAALELPARDITGTACVVVNVAIFASPTAAVWRALRELDPSRVPVLFTSLALACASCWGVFGLLIGDVYLMTPNFIGMGLSAAQLGVLAYIRRVRAARERAHVPLVEQAAGGGEGQAGGAGASPASVGGVAAVTGVSGDGGDGLSPLTRSPVSAASAGTASAASGGTDVVIDVTGGTPSERRAHAATAVPPSHGVPAPSGVAAWLRSAVWHVTGLGAPAHHPRIAPAHSSFSLSTAAPSADGDGGHGMGWLARVVSTDALVGGVDSQPVSLNPATASLVLVGQQLHASGAGGDGGGGGGGRDARPVPAVGAAAGIPPAPLRPIGCGPAGSRQGARATSASAALGGGCGDDGGGDPLSMDGAPPLAEVAATILRAVSAHHRRATGSSTPHVRDIAAEMAAARGTPKPSTPGAAAAAIGGTPSASAPPPRAEED